MRGCQVDATTIRTLPKCNDPQHHVEMLRARVGWRSGGTAAAKLRSSTPDPADCSTTTASVVHVEQNGDPSLYRSKSLSIQVLSTQVLIDGVSVCLALVLRKRNSEHQVDFLPMIATGLTGLGTWDMWRTELVALGLLSVTQVLVTCCLVAMARSSHNIKLIGSTAIWWVIVISGVVGLAQIATLTVVPESTILLIGTLTALVGAVGALAAFPDFSRWPVSAMFPKFLTEAEAEGVRLRAALERVNNEHAAELVALTRRFEPALQKSNVFISTQDLDLRYTWVLNPPSGLSAAAMVGERDDNVQPPHAAEQIIALKRLVLADERSRHQEIAIVCDSGVRWYDVSIEALRNGKTAIVGVSTVVVDLTDRKRIEAQLLRLTRDVTHRTKNVLAVVHAIARQTATRGAGEFLESFGNRVQSLARSHDLLASHDWRGIGLNDLIRAQLVDYAELVGGRITLSGPDVTLGPEATQNLGLAIHELADNARKHGALSERDATISIEWQFVGDAENLKPDAGGRALSLRWVERGVSTQSLNVSRRAGFGRAFLETAVGRTLDGCAKFELLADGLVYEIAVPSYHIGAANSS